MVKVPWAAWAGYESATEEARGMIVKYIGYNGGTFDIKFDREVGSAPLKGISWAQLFGETPVVRDVMLTLQMPLGSTSALFAKPGSRPPASADCWDMRLGAWVMCTGEVVDAQTRQQLNQLRVSDAGRNAVHRASAHRARARGRDTESPWLIPAGNIDVWRRPTPEQLPSPGTHSLIRPHI